MSNDFIHYVDVPKLTAIEGHGRKRVLWLKEKIEREGVWTAPLMVEASKFLVMDGHHRFEVAKALGLRKVPAKLFTYDEVEVWSLRSNIKVSREIILDNHESGVLFPYKTAKHKFPECIVEFGGVSLHELM